MGPEGIRRHAGTFVHRGDHCPKEMDGQLAIDGLCNVVADDYVLYRTQTNRA
jgi:hypothetical protein